MKISLNWLKNFVHIPTCVSPQDLALNLTLKVVEVSHVHDVASDLAGVVVGKVLRVRKHPNADQLRLCMVEIGKQTISVVCGGSNVREGMFVALGMVGAKVKWHGEGETVELKTTKIRGETSEGMICASDEIGIEEMFPKSEEKEIIDLSYFPGVQVGGPLAKILGLDDVIIEIDNSSLNHRPDLWGHYGMAREIGAIYATKLKPYNPPKIKSGKETYRVDVKVKDRCRAYAGVAVKGITIADSPAFLQARLTACGLRPINNIVDITNYVMLEIGQPTHAFDLSALASPHIIVRGGKEGETMVTLDGKERKLREYMVVIADKEKALAVGGVMGGHNSEVTRMTTGVWFESANFQPVTIRKTAKALGLRTDGSVRWEKNQDSTNASRGLRRLIELTLQLCPGSYVASNVIDDVFMKWNAKPILLDLDFVERKMGVAIPKKTVIHFLECLGFEVKTKRKGVAKMLEVTIPTWRAKDISIQEDLVEEIARMHGYNNIPITLPLFPIQPPARNSLRDLQKIFREILAYECGYTEVYNYSFESREWLQKLGEDISAYIELENPLAKDRPLLRRHLIPGLLETMEKNLHRFDHVKVFEVGRVFHKETQGDFADPMNNTRLPGQPTLLGMTYASKGDDIPFFEISGAIARVFERLGVSYRLNKQGKIYSDIVHPGRFAEMVVGETVVGRIAELQPLMQEKLGIPYRVAIVQITLDDLASFFHDTSKYSPLPVYPSVERDIAFVVEKQASHADIISHIKAASPLIDRVTLFDVYQDAKIAHHKKSMAYRIVYQPDDRTLTSEEVDQEHEKVCVALREAFGAEMRDK